MRLGLLNPKNFVESGGGGGFKEGIRKVTAAAFKVDHQEFEGSAPRPPVVALVLTCERLDDDLDPMVDDATGEAIIETLKFPLGGKSLSKIHPAEATGPEDDEPEDLGVEVNTEGPTLFVVDQKWQLDPRSGCAHLMASLSTKLKEGFLDNVWAPNFVGLVAFFKTVPDEAVKIAGKDGVERPVNYKVVDKVITAPYDGKTSKKGKGVDFAAKNAENKAAKAAKAPKEASPEETLLIGILKQIAEDMAGETLTIKALGTMVSSALNKSGNTKQLVPVQTVLKSEGWLAKNGEKAGLSVDEDDKTVTFEGGE
jgi:hypothetical protein